MNQTVLDKCKDCLHFERCKWLIGINGNETECDWNPSRFIPILTNAKNCLDPPRVASVLPIRTLECKDEDENK